MSTLPFHRTLRQGLFLAALALPFGVIPVQQARAAVFISVGFAPPVLPVYAQPVCPGDGYLWTPGYWAYGDDGYFWVPGVWVQPPSPGLLWTPSYWAWNDGQYVYNPGYWGPQVGYYGGINYGFGYTGVGFFGGEWRGGAFFYNRSVANIDVVHVTNVYSRTVVVNNRTTIAYNGGPGGVAARPTPEQAAFARQTHVQPTANQMAHQGFASQDRTEFASVNHGRPGVPAAATVAAYHANPGNPAGAARPTGFAGRGAEANQPSGFGSRPAVGNPESAPLGNQRPAYAAGSNPGSNDGNQAQRPAYGGAQPQGPRPAYGTGAPQAERPAYSGTPAQASRTPAAAPAASARPSAPRQPAPATRPSGGTEEHPKDKH